MCPIRDITAIDNVDLLLNDARVANKLNIPPIIVASVTTKAQKLRPIVQIAVVPAAPINPRQGQHMKRIPLIIYISKIVVSDSGKANAISAPARAQVMVTSDIKNIPVPALLFGVKNFL